MILFELEIFELNRKNIKYIEYLQKDRVSDKISG